MASAKGRSGAEAAVTEQVQPQTDGAENLVAFDEQSLAEASILGSSQAFEELYTHYFPKVRAFCIRKTGNREVAEDIAQEAFTRAFSRIDEFGGEKKFGGWVGTIAANLCTDHFRRKRNSEVSLNDDSDTGPAYEVDPIRNLQRDDTSRLVRLALDKLDPRQREALLMHEIKGLTCGAIGDELGITEVAAESLIARARRRLRKEITAKAAPADLFGLGGLGLLPALWRAWRRAREAASNRLAGVQAATGRAVDAAGLNALPGVDAAKALVVVMGAALAVEVASAAAPPVQHAVPTPAGQTALEVLPADGDLSTLNGGSRADDGERGTRVPVSGHVDPFGGTAGVSSEGGVTVPDTPGTGKHTGLKYDVEAGLDEDGTASVTARVVVRGSDGEVVHDTGEIGIDTGE